MVTATAPQIGLTVAFTRGPFAGIPAHLTRVYARLIDGDLLVGLEYSPPVRVDDTLIQRLDARWSELEVLSC